MEIKLILRDQSVIKFKESQNKLATDFVNQIKFIFQIEGDWQGKELVAQFSQRVCSTDKQAPKTIEKSMPIVNDSVLLPKEFAQYPGQLFVSVFGKVAGEVTTFTSIPTEYQLVPSGFMSNAEEPIPPTPDLYDLLMEELKETESNVNEKAEEVQEAADKVTRAETAAVNAEKAAQNANDVATELTRAKEAGEFDGADGAQGPIGPVGPIGPKGEPGEPGTTDYRELLNKPHRLYIPTAQTVNITSIDSGIYDVTDNFMLKLGNNTQTELISAGDILCVDNWFANDYFKAIHICNNDVIYLQHIDGDEEVIKVSLNDLYQGFEYLYVLLQNKQDTLIAGTGISIVNGIISATLGLTFEIVQTLPQTGNNQTIYLVPNSGSGSNIYDEYIWVNSAFEKIGTTEIDLSGYVTIQALATALLDYYNKTEIDNLISGKQNTINAGINIDVTNDVISSPDKSNKAVETLPSSNIDENTYYLTKATRPAINYGDYCSNKVIYPTADLPSWTYNSLVTVILYNSFDGCFYRLMQEHVQWAGNAVFSYTVDSNGIFTANCNDAHLYCYKYDPANPNGWEQVYNKYGKTLTFFQCSPSKKIKFVWTNVSRPFIADGVEYTVSNENTADIYANFFTSGGTYLDNDPDNADESNIFNFNMNVFRNNAWSVVGQMDLQIILEQFAKINDLLSYTTSQDVAAMIEDAVGDIDTAIDDLSEVVGE